MTTTRKLLWAITGFYVAGIVVLIILFGFGHQNHSFQVQNEFKLDNWVQIGVFSINRAVLYLILATILTVVTMVWIADRMHQRPNKVQTAVEVLFSLMRDNITRGNMPDSMAAKWFPFLGALFLFIWFNNLIGYIPLTNSGGIRHFRPTSRRSRFAATANISVPLILAPSCSSPSTAGHLRPGPDRLSQEPDPGRRHRADLAADFPLEVISTFMRLLADHPLRQYPGRHLIILFMAGGLAVLLDCLSSAGSPCRLRSCSTCSSWPA
jgi:F-type H+-transporting ATPase subunit a